jgi:hypothetical protein
LIEKMASVMIFLPKALGPASLQASQSGLGFALVPGPDGISHRVSLSNCLQKYPGLVSMS